MDHIIVTDATTQQGEVRVTNLDTGDYMVVDAHAEDIRDARKELSTDGH